MKWVAPEFCWTAESYNFMDVPYRTIHRNMRLYYQKDVCEPCEGDLLKLQRFSIPHASFKFGTQHDNYI
jgi:hypothetical protein